MLLTKEIAELQEPVSHHMHSTILFWKMSMKEPPLLRTVFLAFNKESVYNFLTYRSISFFENPLSNCSDHLTIVARQIRFLASLAKERSLSSNTSQRLSKRAGGFITSMISLLHTSTRLLKASTLPEFATAQWMSMMD